MDSVRRGYDTIAGQFAASRANLRWPGLSRFRDYLKDGDRVLDLGCGSGRAIGLLSGLAVDYEGLDRSPALIEQAKQRNQDVLVNFRVGSMLELPYDDRSFDAVLAIASLHHVPSEQYRRQALREAWRVLRPGGYLLMSNWDLWRPAGWPWLARNFLRKLIGRSDLDWRDALVPWRRGDRPTVWRYYHAFTGKETSRLCRQAGFTVLDQRVSRQPRRRQANRLTVARRPAND